MSVLGRLRRVLAARYSIAALAECAMWSGLVHLAFGIFFTFLQPGYVDLFEQQVQLWFPAGAQIVAFGLSIGLWPILLIAPQICAA